MRSNGRRSGRSTRRCGSTSRREARRDPLARGTLLALGATALVALVLASLGLALAVRSDLRDDRGEHYDLEAQGSSPAFLRRVVRTRAATRLRRRPRRRDRDGARSPALVTRVVSVTARGAAAEPPLAAVVDPRSSSPAVSCSPRSRRSSWRALLAGRSRACAARRTGRSSSGAARRCQRAVRRVPVADGRCRSAPGPFALRRTKTRSASCSARAGRGRRLSCACSPASRACLRARSSSQGSTSCTHLRVSSGAIRRDVLGYADQHYWRALAGELTAEELVALPLGLASASTVERRRGRESCSSASICSIARRQGRPSSPEASSSASRCARRSLTARDS